MAEHKDILADGAHVLHRWKVADQTALDAIVTVSTDIDKIAIKTDTNTYHRLISIVPNVFKEVGLDKVISDSAHFAGSGTTVDPLTLSTEFEEMHNFFIGQVYDEVQGVISSDGIDVIATIQQAGGGDLRYQTSSGVAVLDCDPTPVVVDLIEGSDSVPQLNYIYINEATNTVLVSTTGFPSTGEYAPLAEIYIGSAPFVLSDGTYNAHKWADHFATAGGNGHLSEMNSWIRSQYATWRSGCALTHSGSGTATVNVAVSSGVMLQLHKHSTEAIITPAPAYIVNHETTPFTKITNVADITTDSEGTSINNKYASLVFFYAYSEIVGDSKLFINKPSGSYSSEADARSDGSGYTNFSIPEELKNTAFLVHRMIVRNVSGTVTVFDGAKDDLRGTLPNTASGSSTAVSSTFLDSVFRVQNLADTTKQIALDGSNITAATTRTITMPDSDLTLAGTDIDNTFTESTRGTIKTGANALTLGVQELIEFTATVADITIASQVLGQDGWIKISSAENITGWTTDICWGYTGGVANSAPTGLTGEIELAYIVKIVSGLKSVSMRVV